MKPLCEPPFPLDYIEEMTALMGGDGRMKSGWLGGILFFVTILAVNFGVRAVGFGLDAHTANQLAPLSALRRQDPHDGAGTYCAGRFPAFLSQMPLRVRHSLPGWKDGRSCTGVKAMR